MLQSPPLRPELFLLALPGTNSVDLGELEAVELLLANPLPAFLPQAREIVSRRVPAPHELGEAIAPLLAPGEAIEQQELTRRLHEPLMLVLAVELHQRVPQPLQEPHRGGSVIDEHAVPAGPCHLPLDHELAAQQRMAGCLEDPCHRAARPRLEESFHHRRLRAGSDEVGLRTCADDQQEGIDDDGLARARLAGEDVEARAEGHRHLLDDGKVAKPELGQHGAGAMLRPAGAAGNAYPLSDRARSPSGRRTHSAG